MWTRALDFLFPPQCGACGAIGSGWCLRCETNALPRTEQRGALRVHALGAYEGALRQAILALKDGRRDVAQAFGERVAAFITNGASIVPVPTTRVRRRMRGIDGVVEIARAASLGSGARLYEALVQEAGDAQRGRSRNARLRASGRFACVRRLEGVRAILLDDVCTTGATLLDCAAALGAAGAVVREAVVVAIAPNAPCP